VELLLDEGEPLVGFMELHRTGCDGEVCEGAWHTVYSGMRVGSADKSGGRVLVGGSEPWEPQHIPYVVPMAVLQTKTEPTDIPGLGPQTQPPAVRSPVRRLSLLHRYGTLRKGHMCRAPRCAARAYRGRSILLLIGA
jgi:hypothetical protein